SPIRCVTGSPGAKAMSTKLTTMTPRTSGTALNSRRATYLPSPPPSPPAFPAAPLIASLLCWSRNQAAGRADERDPPARCRLLSEPEELETVALIEERPHAPEARGGGFGGELVEHDHGGHVFGQYGQHLVVDGRARIEVGEAGSFGQ